MVAGQAVRVVQGDGELSGVAGGEEAGHGDVLDHRVSDDHGGLRGADLGGVVADGHQAQLAFEVGDLDRDVGGAVRADGDRAGEQGDDLGALHGKAGAAGLAAIAAFVDVAGIGAAVEEVAVIVADVQAEVELAVEERERVRRGVAGELQDAFVDRRQSDVGRVPLREAGEFYRDGDGLAGGDLGGGVDGDGQMMGGGVDADPGDAERAHGVERAALAEGTDHGDDDIGAGAPLRVGGDVDGGTFLRDVHGLG